MRRLPSTQALPIRVCGTTRYLSVTHGRRRADLHQARRPLHAVRGAVRGNRATAYMVSEKVAYEIFNLGDERFAATSGRQTAPVCAACVTPAEEADLTRERACEGCGLAMRSQFKVRTCSRRCAMRALRAPRRRHMRPMSHCVVCGASFKPKRSDSVYRSAACKQRAYRCRA